MNILIIHPSFPGQYFYLCRYLAKNPENRVMFLAKDNAIETNLKGVELALYKAPREVNKETHHYMVPAEEAILTAIHAPPFCIIKKCLHNIPKYSIIQNGGNNNRKFSNIIICGCSSSVE